MAQKDPHIIFSVFVMFEFFPEMARKINKSGADNSFKCLN